MRLGTGCESRECASPASSYAGGIEAIGSNATAFAAGDAVYGAARGPYAEYVVTSQPKWH